MCAAEVTSQTQHPQDTAGDTENNSDSLGSKEAVVEMRQGLQLLLIEGKSDNRIGFFNVQEVIMKTATIIVLGTGEAKP